MIHRIAYVLVAGVFFWLGALHQEASKPVQPFRIAPQAPQKAALQLSCNSAGLQEWYRTCRARKRSDSIKERNSK